MNPVRNPSAGFTLVEVLVAVSLLSVLMVALGGAMRTMAQTEARIDKRTQQMDDLRVTTAFLQQVLGRVSARKTPAPHVPGGKQVLFRATPNSIEWVGIMPARHGLGGRYFFRLQPEDAGEQVALVLRFAPWDAQAPAFPDWSQASARTLLPKLGQFAVSAQGRPTQNQALPPNWPKGWVAGWPVPDHLPERLHIGWSTAETTWPDLVISVRALTQGAGLGGGFAIGGSR